MKTLITAALLAALTLVGFARADETPKSTTPAPAKAAERMVTLEDVKAALEQMGYTPQAQRNKDGKVVNYVIEVTRGATTIPISFSLAPSGTRVWLNVGLIVFDEKFPATEELLLELLAKHDELWPAYIGYFPNTKFARLSMSMDVANFGPATLRPQIDRMLDKVQIVLDTVKKVQAAQQKAKEGTPTTPNPIP